MSSAHLFYIPLVLMVGLVAGFLLGRRAGIAWLEQELEHDKRRAERRAKRAARRAADEASDGEAPTASG